jgi:thiamine kinase-like enzyme
LFQRQNETRAYRRLAPTGIVPRLISEQGDELITQHIDGRHLNCFDYQSESFLEMLLAKMKTVHHMRVDTFNRARSSADKCALIARELKQHYVRLPTVLLNEVERTLQLDVTQPTALIHGDLHCKNMILDKSDRLYIIDWADCGVGDPLEDLAEIAIFFPAEQHGELLKRYDGGFDLHRFHTIYRQRMTWFALWAYQIASEINAVDLDKRWNEILASPRKSFHQIINCLSRGLMQLKTRDDYLLFSALSLNHAFKTR